MAKNDKKKEVAAAPAKVAAPAPELVDFDVWHVMRSKRIPAHHLKEIIKADFKGRGLKDKESAEVFDKALESYGIKL